MEQIPYSPSNLQYIVKEYTHNLRGFLKDCLLIKELDTWQDNLVSMIQNGETRIAIASCNGSGKGNHPDALIPTPTGYRRYGDLRPNDFVIGSDGKPTKIRLQFDWGIVPYYEVKFSDGTSTRVSKGHLFRVEKRKRDWEEIDVSVEDIGETHRANGNNRLALYRLPVQPIVDFVPQTTTNDPYLFGLWLADGCHSNKTITKPHIQHLLDSNGNYTYVCHKYGEKCRFAYCKDLKINGKDGKLNEYIFNNVDVRRDFLRGLLDGDGDCDKNGSVGFCSTNMVIFDAVVETLRSLGIIPRIGAIEQKYAVKDGIRKPGKLSRRLSFRPRINPFTAGTQKYDRCQQYLDSNIRKLDVNRKYIESVTLSEPAHCVCLNVEAADGLYLCENYTITHNTYITSAIELWWLLTHPDATISICSATYAQVTEVHFREIRAHINNSIIREFYDLSSSERIRLPGSGDAAFISAINNNPTRPEGLAGRHHGSLLTVFDEASAIHREIFLAQEGNMSTEGAVWITIGNPISSGTPFHDIFQNDLRWNTMHIDARKSKFTDKQWVQGMIDAYGLDDDRVRARILGEFPRGSVNTCVSEFDYDEAVKRTPYSDDSTPVVIGLDVSRCKGRDATVICARKGNHLIDIREVIHIDNVDLAEQTEIYFKKYKAQVICIDYSGGYGAGPGDILQRILPTGSVREVQFGGKSSDNTRWLNKRAEMWAKYGEWIKKAMIPKNDLLRKDSINIEYWFNAKGLYQVESKDDYESRTHNDSPDWGDSVCCSLYVDLTGIKKNSKPDDLFTRIRRHSQGSTWC